MNELGNWVILIYCTQFLINNLINKVVETFGFRINKCEFVKTSLFYFYRELCEFRIVTFNQKYLT